MRINGPNTTFGIQVGKTKKAGEAEGSFSLPDDAEASATNSGARTSGASPMGALIAAQLHGVDEREQDERRRKRQRNFTLGENLLGALDGMKIEMLAGRLTPNQMLKLIGLLDERAHDSDDPRLEAILDEIELRAQVELAKLQRRDSTS